MHVYKIPVMHTHPKRYNLNEYKTLNQKTTASKCLYTLAAVRKSVSLLQLKYLQCHLQCKIKHEYNTLQVTYTNAKCTYNKSDNHMIGIPVYIILPDKISKLHTEPL